MNSNKINRKLTAMNNICYWNFLCIILLIVSSKAKMDDEDEHCHSFIPVDYEKHISPPNPALGVPVDVYTSMSVIDIDEINEENMDFRLHAYLTMTWNDSRLVLDSSSCGMRFRPCHKYLWKPDVIFEAAKKVETFGGNTYFTIMEDRSLYMTFRYSLKVSCTMNFEMYPFDTQNCLFTIVLMSITDSEALLKWMYNGKHDEEAILLINKIEPLQFYLQEPRTYSKSFQFTTANFTYLVVDFTFARRVTGSIVNIYAPSALIVAVSWVTFWLRVDAAPARVALSLTSLLTLCTQVTQYKSQLPPVNYITAMDIWLFVCIFMVFCTLLEFAMSYNTFMKYKDEEDNKINLSISSEVSSLQRDNSSINAWTPSRPSDATRTNLKTCCLAPSVKSVNRLDVLCRKLFPITYIAFVVSYWIFFIKYS